MGLSIPLETYPSMNAGWLMTYRPLNVEMNGIPYCSPSFQAASLLSSMEAKQAGTHSEPLLGSLEVLLLPVRHSVG